MDVGKWLQVGRDALDRHRTKIRFLLAGALNTLFGLSAFPLLYVLLQPFALHYLIILTVSQVVCITFAFLTNKYFVFRTIGNVRSEYLKFVLFHAAYFAVNLVALPAIVNLSNLSPVWSQTIFALAVIVTSYFWHSRVTFFSKKVLVV